VKTGNRIAIGVLLVAAVVIALPFGNPFNLAHTVTVGVISAIDRPFPISEGRWQDVLQTDPRSIRATRADRC
jgi:S1-C subfamily serine protease